MFENGINKPKIMIFNKLEDLDKLKAIKRKQFGNNENPDRRSDENITCPPKNKQFVDNKNWKTKQRK